MHYSEGIFYKNDVVSQYVTVEPKNTKQIEKEINSLLPFLVSDNSPDYWETKVMAGSEAAENQFDNIQMKIEI